jgi:hypothetical protein
MEEQLILEALEPQAFPLFSDVPFPSGSIRWNHHEQEVPKNIFLRKELVPLLASAPDQGQSVDPIAVVHPMAAVENVLPSPFLARLGDV